MKNNGNSAGRTVHGEPSRNGSARRRALPCVVFAAAAIVCPSILVAADTKPISAASLLARTKTLSSDEFEGRAPGSAGEQKTVDYIVGEFKKLGLQPGNPNGTFIEDVP